MGRERHVRAVHRVVVGVVAVRGLEREQEARNGRGGEGEGGDQIVPLEESLREVMGRSWEIVGRERRSGCASRRAPAGGHGEIVGIVGRSWEIVGDQVVPARSEEGVTVTCRYMPLHACLPDQQEGVTSRYVTVCDDMYM